MTHFKTGLCHLLLVIFGVHNQQQTARFQIIKDAEYSVSSSLNFLENITGRSVSTVVKCTQQCVEYPLCETATYYIQIQTCSLYREKYGIGTLKIVSAQTALVISLNYRNPSGNVKRRQYD
jgi:hypothetical protein